MLCYAIRYVHLNAGLSGKVAALEATVAELQAQLADRTVKDSEWC